MKNVYLQLLIVFVLLMGAIQSYAQPTFNSGQDPKPSDKQWVEVWELTDEFNTGSLNTDKWDANPEFIYNGVDRGWYGSERSLFEEDNATETEGQLRLENEKFPSPRYSPKDDQSEPAVRKYGGAYVHGKTLAKPGYYMEARMRAANTAMSAAFWLKTEPLPCADLPIGQNLELDIQECVGIMTGELGDSWTQDDWAVNGQWDQIFHFNTHRHTQCYSGEQETVGGKINHGLNRDAMHIYGAYWYADGTRVDFFHNGEFVKSVTPPIAFQGGLRLIMSSNFYDWIEETTEEAMGFNNDKWARSVKFDWVRTWKLEDTDASTFYIINKATGKKIRNKASVDGDPLELVPASWAGSPTKWTKEETDNGYFFLKNESSGMYFRPTDDTDGSVLIQRPTSYDGSYTQWKQIDSSGDYFYLENRATGMYFRPETEDDYSAIIQRPAIYTGDWTQWQFIDVSSGAAIKSAQIITEQITTQTTAKTLIYPNPVSNGFVTIETGFDEDDTVISIVNISGKMVYNYVGTKQKVQLSVGDFDKGLYIVKIQTGDNTSVHKLTIN